MASIVEVKSVEEFVNSIENSKTLALVDFYATWCGPCKMQSPIIDKVADEIKEGLNVYKVDVDELSDVAVKYGISAVPTLLLFKDGNVVERWVGLTPEHVLKETIENYLKSS
ncbi:MAG: thioredoxin [Planctomycetota bacterium]